MKNYHPLKLRLARSCWCFLLFSGLLFTKNALAYLDPGNGSFFIQILIAALVGLPLTFTHWFKKIESFFAALFKKRGKKPPSQN